MFSSKLAALKEITEFVRRSYGTLKNISSTTYLLQQKNWHTETLLCFNRPQSCTAKNRTYSPKVAK